MRREANRLMVLAVLMTVVVGACKKKPPPVARPMPPPPQSTGGDPPAEAARPAASRSTEPRSSVPPMPAEDSISGKSLDDLNRDSPLSRCSSSSTAPR